MSFFKTVSNPWGVVHLMPDLEHELFFDYLTISPSYQFAHQILENKDLKNEKALKKTSFKKVFETYSIVGNIFHITFDEWWTKHGQFIFIDKNKFSNLNFTLNMLKSKQEILLEVSNAVDIYQQILSNEKERIRFINSKINIGNLNFLKHLVATKSGLDSDEDKPAPDWVVGVYAADYRPNSKYAETFINRYPDLFTSTFSLEKKKSNEKDRQMLGQLVSRQLKESLLIAENAAYAIFPEKKLLANVDYKVFDYEKCAYYLRNRKLEVNGEDLTYTYTRFYQINYHKWKKFEKKYGEDALPNPLSEDERKEFMKKFYSGEIGWYDI